MQLVCKAKILEKSDDSHRIICEVIGSKNPNGDPVPTTIGIRSDAMHATDHLYDAIENRYIIIDLERPPVYLPEQKVDEEGAPVPLYKDKYETVYDGKRMVFRRATGNPNPWFYNVTFGQLDVGYLAMDIYNPSQWFFVPTLINHERFNCDSFETARIVMAKHIFDLMKEVKNGS